MNGLNGNGKKQITGRRPDLFRYLVTRLQEKINEELDKPDGRFDADDLRRYQREVYGI